jgi:antirestriction protein ArdC
MGAAFLSAHAGIAGKALVDNSASYIKHWLAKLRGDNKLVIQAAGLAQKASDFILGVTFDSPAKVNDSDAEQAPA